MSKGNDDLFDPNEIQFDGIDDSAAGDDNPLGEIESLDVDAGGDAFAPVVEDGPPTEKGKKKRKKDKKPRAKKEKKPREKKQKSGEPSASGGMVGLGVVGLLALGLVAADAYIIVSHMSGSVLFFVFLLLFNMLGLVVVGIPFLMWKNQQRLSIYETCLGLGAVALAIGCVLLLLEIANYGGELTASAKASPAPIYSTLDSESTLA